MTPSIRMRWSWARGAYWTARVYWHQANVAYWERMVDARLEAQQ